MVADIVQKVLQNNPQAVYLNLVKQGFMLPGTSATVADIISVIEMQMVKPGSANFLIATFDVVVNNQGLYAAELMQLTTSRGKSIQFLLMDELANQTPESPLASITASLSSPTTTEAVPVWIVLLVAVLTFIGIVVVARGVWKVIGKIFN
jgi:phosphate/sulfate permease